MFPIRQKFIEGSWLIDKHLANLAYAKFHGVDGANTIPVVFELVKMVKPKTCVVIGSGEGLIPRVIREAQVQCKIENSKTYLIDLGANMGAMPQEIHNPKALFRELYPEIVVFKGRSVPDGVEFVKKSESKIDVLWIDGDHSFMGSKSDFLEYSPLVGDDGLIFLHDTAPNGAGEIQPPWCGVDKTIEYIMKNHNEFELINFTPTKYLNFGSGFAILKRKLQKKI